MRKPILCAMLALCASAVLGAVPLQAAALRISPTQIAVSGGATSTLTVRNEGREPVAVQVRVFRSVPAGDGFRLEQTDDVVASPPITTLQPGSENLVRIVRVAGSRPSGPESYRLLVDEVPDPRRQRSGTVSIVVRHSIPVSFVE